MNRSNQLSPLVLIIDDDNFMRVQLRHALEEVGYRVAEASDGAEGLAAYSQLHPDVVLLDALMPVMDGFTCCSALQVLFNRDPKGGLFKHRTPILMITALEDQHSVDRAFEVGASDYITKPIHWAVLRQRVHHLLRANRAMEELQRQNQRAELFADLTLKIRQSLKLEEILQTTVTEVQKLLQADRVLIFRLWANGFGKVVTEAVVPNQLSVMDYGTTDECLGLEYFKKYDYSQAFVINDISEYTEHPCLVKFLQDFSVKAKLVMPLRLKDHLWGLIIIHQCDRPRQWDCFEIELLQQLADQVTIALAQAQLLEQETHRLQELARYNDELEQFTSIASHDLQEPLRKIQIFGERLKDKYSEGLTEQGLDYLERMQNAAQRMRSLIEDLLTLSRLTTKAQPFIKVNLSQIAEEVLSDLDLRLQQTQGLVRVGELPTIDADPIQMRQLFQNLISNALKFHTNSPPIVKLYSKINLIQQRCLRRFSEPSHLEPVPELCQIIVEDNGIGFDELYVEQIFKAFQRLHSRNEYEGTGMGLAICRKIAERHGGSITAKSIPGEGATFIVTLPIKQPKGEI